MNGLPPLPAPFALSLSKGKAEPVEAPSLRSGEGSDFASGEVYPERLLQAGSRQAQPERSWGGNPMIPGEILPLPGDIVLNEGRTPITLTIANSGDRPIQVGSHYHFAETNPALLFDRDTARGYRLDIPSGTAVRFEPGQSRDVQLIPYAGDRIVIGFRGDVMGEL